MDSIQVSPFKFKAGMSTILTNKRTKCDSNGIEAARQKGILTDLDMYIIHCIYDFGLINKNAVTAFLNAGDTVPKHLKKPDYTRNFHNLTEHGILLRYNFAYNDRSTPNVYTLSKGAKKYAARIFSRGFQKLYRSPEIDITDVGASLRLAAFNQFYVRLITSGHVMSRSLYDYIIPYKGRQILIDAIVSIKGSSGDMFDFVFICLRQTENWQEMFRNTLYAAMSHQRKLHIEIPEFIVISESDIMAAEAEKYRLTIPDLNRLNIYYLPDVMAISEKPLTMVYRVLPGNGCSQYDEIYLNLN